MSFNAKITADISGFKSGIEEATQATKKATKDIKSSFDGISKNITGLGKKLSVLSVGISAFGAKAFSMATDFEDALGATDQVFKGMSETVKNWASELNSAYGIAKKDALEYSNVMGTMLINIGKLSRDEAQKTSASLVELAGDLTAMFGGTTENAVNALTASLRGNNVMLNQYGIAINDVMVKQRALEMGLIASASEMTLQARQAATLSLIMEQSASAQGQAAREANSASGAVRAFKTEIANLSTELGEVLIPILTPMLNKLASLASSFKTLSPEIKTAIVAIGGIAVASGPALIALGQIIKIAPLIGAGFTALTGPIGIAVGAIAGISALVISNWDAIKEYFTSGGGSELFQSIKNLADVLWNDLKVAFNQIKTLIVGVWSYIGDFVKSYLGTAFVNVVKILTVAVKSIRNTLSFLIKFINGDFKGAWQSFKDFFSDIWVGIRDIALNSIATLTNTIGGMLKFLKMDKWGESLITWSKNIRPEVEATTKAIENTTEKIKEQTVAVDNLNLATGELSTTQKLATGELSTTQKLAFRDVGLVSGLGVAEGAGALKIVPEIDTSKIKHAMGDLTDGIRVLTIDLQDMLTSSLVDIMGAVSTALVEGDNVMGSLGVALLGTLGGIMVDLGKMTIGAGVAIEAVKKALTTLNPIGALAAGAGLIAIGSLFAAGARKLGSGMGGGSYSYGGGYSSTGSQVTPTYGPSQYRGQYQDDYKVEFKIGTNELVGVLDMANQRRNRL